MAIKMRILLILWLVTSTHAMINPISWLQNSVEQLENKVTSAARNFDQKIATDFRLAEKRVGDKLTNITSSMKAAAKKAAQYTAELLAGGERQAADLVGSASNATVAVVKDALRAAEMAADSLYDEAEVVVSSAAGAVGGEAAVIGSAVEEAAGGVVALVETPFVAVEHFVKDSAYIFILALVLVLFVLIAAVMVIYYPLIKKGVALVCVCNDERQNQDIELQV